MNAGAVAPALFGGYYRKRRNDFAFLTNDLVKARMHVPIERWLSTATLYSLLLSLAWVTLGQAVSALLFGYVLIWRFLFAFNSSGFGRRKLPIWFFCIWWSWRRFDSNLVTSS